MDEKLDNIKLTKLFTYIHEPKFDVEFSDDEVNDFNEYVHNNDIDSINKLFQLKENIGTDVLKDIIHSKVDTLWQFVMDSAYDKWKDNNISREEFLNQLTDYEKVAVIFGNFNYQVENGGLSQWDDNGYSDDFDSLYDFIQNSDYSKKDKFLQILDNFSNVKSAIDDLDPYNDWYDEDLSTRLNSLEYSDKDYYNIKDNWKDYFENYLINNISDEYKDKIMELSTITI